MHKTAKERRQQEADAIRYQQSKAAWIEHGPRTSTWSARMPAYCFTSLCPGPVGQAMEENYQRGETGNE